SWTDAPIMPTPGAVGSLIEMIAKKEGISVVGVDIGGATTDIFSVFEEKFNRTVSANLGMSYSICNVLAEAGLDNVLRWVPFDIDRSELTNRIGNKMIRPTTVPQSLEELVIEQAIAREALRLSFIQHKAFATSLKGVQSERTISDAFEQSSSGQSLVNMMDLDLLVGSGGVLSHAPRRQQSARMLIDAFMPEGITQLAVDSIFMMPQLGVLANIDKEELKDDASQAALEVFDNDCLIRLGTCVSPVGKAKPKSKMADVTMSFKDGSTKTIEIKEGSLEMLEFPYEEVKVHIEPSRGIDVGAGKGEPLDSVIYGGVVGLIFDGRNRPITLSTDPSQRIDSLLNWSSAVDEYPKGDLF
ncbi:MAG: methylaspartate mutase, partial [Candidatus Marinimicrobia bacterium]|nr:methylaspartate mutase [Candidatus Neomarinimicrobiota bacterium]